MNTDFGSLNCVAYYTVVYRGRRTGSVIRISIDQFFYWTIFSGLIYLCFKCVSSVDLVTRFTPKSYLSKKLRINIEKDM